MTVERHISSKPDRWISPRAHTDAGLRFNHYGPLVPMESANDNPHRGTIRLFLASAGLIIAVVLAAVAGGA